MSFWSRLKTLLAISSPVLEPGAVSSRGPEPCATQNAEELEFWSRVTGYEVIAVETLNGRVSVVTTRYPYLLPVHEILERRNGEA